ncbi:hypothetical protein EDB89DRAFT_2074628 [Lactarius sanguifluus]|nr:hypothetical protein EDB89DRAFT_2074628 [Lactarius sanguifluus]
MPPLPDTFLGGSAPCLQTIYISGIPFPAAPILLSSARDLVDLDLSNIPLTGYISPEAMVTSLGALPRLKFLTLGFEEYGISYPDRMRLPSTTRTVLPALTIFYFDGLFEYFEDLVAQIDTPQLVCLGAKYLDLGVTDFQIPQLCDFIDRSQKLRFGRAELLIQPGTVVIELTQRIQSSFRLVVQQDAIDQVVNQISAILSNVDRLFICSEPEEGDDEPDDRIPWFELFRPFTAVKVLSVDEGVSWQIPLEFEEITEDRAAELLPALELLCLENQPVGYMDNFVTARRNVGRPVTVIEEEFEESLSIFGLSE